MMIMILVNEFDFDVFVAFNVEEVFNNLIIQISHCLKTQQWLL